MESDFFRAFNANQVDHVKELTTTINVHANIAQKSYEA